MGALLAAKTGVSGKEEKGRREGEGKTGLEGGSKEGKKGEKRREGKEGTKKVGREGGEVRRERGYWWKRDTYVYSEKKG